MHNCHLYLLQLKIHATEKSISSPISDDYNPKAETADSILKLQDNNTNSSNYISSTFYIFPFLTIPLLLFSVFYYNDLTEHSRMKKIIKTFAGNDDKKKWNYKYQLQNEFVLSQLFVVYTMVISTLGVGFTIDTGKRLNHEITDYFNLAHGTVRSRHSTSLPILALILDLIVLIPLQLIVGYWCYKKSGYGEWIWRYCAYSIVFPLCCAANHLNFIIIAFIHDVYHAILVLL